MLVEADKVEADKNQVFEDNPTRIPSATTFVWLWIRAGTLVPVVTMVTTSL